MVQKFKRFFSNKVLILLFFLVLITGVILILNKYNYFTLNQIYVKIIRIILIAFTSIFCASILIKLTEVKLLHFINDDNDPNKPIINFGNNLKVTDNVKIALKGVPTNFNVKLNKIKNDMYTILNKSHPERIYLDTEGTIIYFIITYKVAIEKKLDIQTQIIAYLAVAFKNYITK